MKQYDSKTRAGKCIFCELTKGNIKFNGTFFENKKYIAFLSGYPNTEGFTVIIPKKHYGSDVLAMPHKELSEFVLTAKLVSKILIKHFTDVGRVAMITEGMGIDHAHIKLFPMHGTSSLKTGKWRQVNTNVTLFFKKYPGYVSSHDGVKADEKKLRLLAEKLRNIR